MHGLAAMGHDAKMPCASTTIELMVDPISMIKPLGKQWWLY